MVNCKLAATCCRVEAHKAEACRAEYSLGDKLPILGPMC